MSEETKVLACNHKDEVHSDTNTNNGDRINQAGTQEECALQT
jgi:hypothetical protein